MTRRRKKRMPGKSSNATVKGVVLYARVSSREQATEGYSIEAQVKLLREYAAANKLAILREFIDVETAKRAGRVAFNEMLKFLSTAEGSGCAVLVEKTDRLCRNLPDWATLDGLKVPLHLVKEGSVITEDSNSNAKMIHGFKVLMAKNYVDNLSEETRKGMKEKAEQGMYPSAAPIGYANVKSTNGKRSIVPDPEYAPMIRRLFQWYLTGAVPLDALSARLTSEGWVSPQTGKPFPRASVHNMLKCRTYSGSFQWNGVTYKGSYEPLVDPKVWEEVQRLLKARGSCPEHPVKHEFAYSGIVRCAFTGRLLTPDIKKRKYIYYSPARFDGPGKRPFVREEVLDQQFSDVLRELSFGNDILEDVSKALRESHADQRRYCEEQTARLQAEYTKLKGRLDQMYVDKLDGRVTQDFYDAKSAEWRAEQAKLLETMHAHQTATAAYFDDGVRLLALAQKAHTLFLQQTAAERAKLLKLVCSNCTWKEGQLVVTLQEPFEALRVAAKGPKAAGAAAASQDDPRKDWLRLLDSNQQPVD